MTSIKPLPAITLACIALTPCDLVAQVPSTSRSTTTGPNVGVHYSGVSVRFDDRTGAETGGGPGARLGLGLTRWLMLYAAFDAPGIAREQGSGFHILYHAEAGGRASFGSEQSRWRPYAEVAATRWEAGPRDEGSYLIEYGRAYTFGGGVQYFVLSGLAVDAALKQSNGKFTSGSDAGQDVTLGNRGTTTSRRFNLGVSWFAFGTPLPFGW